MKVKLTKDWAAYKKGETVEVTDEAVLKAGFNTGLFVNPQADQIKETPKEKPKNK